jgi:hypothetical protein
VKGQSERPQNTAHTVRGVSSKPNAAAGFGRAIGRGTD